jgi:hypothetical protein
VVGAGRGKNLRALSRSGPRPWRHDRRRFVVNGARSTARSDSAALKMHRQLKLRQSMRPEPAANRLTSSAGASMKQLSFLAVLAMLAACAESPTQPTAQPAVQNLSLALSSPRAAANPSGTGQPGASCGSTNASTEPNGFSSGGFANAETHYAGSKGTPSLANGSPKAVSQYDVACYQLSNK